MANGQGMQDCSAPNGSPVSQPSSRGTGVISGEAGRAFVSQCMVQINVLSRSNSAAAHEMVAAVDHRRKICTKSSQKEPSMDGDVARNSQL